jgi:hypothetical protein
MKYKTNKNNSSTLENSFSNLNISLIKIWRLHK